MANGVEELIGKWIHVRAGASTLYGYGGMPTDYYGILAAVDDTALYVDLPNGETAYLPRHTIRRIAEMEIPPEGDAGTLLRAADASALPLLRPATREDVDSSMLPRLIDLGARLVPKRFRRG